MLDSMPEHTDEAVSAVIKPAVVPLATEIGRTLSNLLYLAFGNINLKAEAKRTANEVYITKLRTSLENNCCAIPEADRKSPNIQIAVPALEKARYCITSEILREMFASLVASSMMISKEKIIHPSYPDIIAQMSPDDAEALLTFAKAPVQPLCDFVLYFNYTNDFDVLFNHIWRPCYSIDDIERNQLITQSLSRLGLIEFTTLDQLDDETYDEICGKDVSAFLDNYLKQNPKIYRGYTLEQCKIVPHKGWIKLTRFGDMFLRCVH